MTLAASERLFKKGRTPDEILALSEETIRQIIYPVGFYPTKAKRLREISREIIERFGGKISMYSTEGEGTTITFTLPLV